MDAQPALIDSSLLHTAFGMGVAGNFAGHLEQAGESRDFANVASDEALPKGIFPWYAPGSQSFLGAYPLSSIKLQLPHAEARVQIEPEAALICDIARDAAGSAVLLPRVIAAFDDCSVRRRGARRISEKKNWGAASKGLAATGFHVDPNSWVQRSSSLRIASFLVRGGDAHEYGVDSALSSYTCFGEPLLAWMQDRLSHQRAADDTPLEDVGALLDASGSARLVVGIGATAYTPIGETTFVEPGDDAIVAVYDPAACSPQRLHQHIAAGDGTEAPGVSLLRRRAILDV